MRKSVRIGSTEYIVGVYENGVEATEIVYPLSGYGNNYGTTFSLELLKNSKKWAKAEIYCWNDTWACRGHGMTDAWTESEWFIKKSKAQEFIQQITKEIEEAEDKTPDIKEIFTKIVNFLYESGEE